MLPRIVGLLFQKKKGSPDKSVRRSFCFAVMDGSKCIVQIRGVRPFLLDKYDLTKHPKYYLTADADKKNWFDVYEVIEIS